MSGRTECFFSNGLTDNIRYLLAFNMVFEHLKAQTATKAQMT